MQQTITKKVAKVEKAYQDKKHFTFDMECWGLKQMIRKYCKENFIEVNQ
jgi:hypothetical protein